MIMTQPFDRILSSSSLKPCSNRGRFHRPAVGKNCNLFALVLSRDKAAPCMTLAADVHIDSLDPRTAGIPEMHMRFDSGFINIHQAFFRNVFYFIRIRRYFFWILLLFRKSSFFTWCRICAQISALMTGSSRMRPRFLCGTHRGALFRDYFLIPGRWTCLSTLPVALHRLGHAITVTICILHIVTACANACLSSMVFNYSDSEVLAVSHARRVADFYLCLKGK